MQITKKAPESESKKNRYSSSPCHAAEKAKKKSIHPVIKQQHN